MTFKEYLSAYTLYHRHPVNKALHIAGIPLIMVGTVALFSSYWKVGLVVFVADEEIALNAGIVYGMFECVSPLEPRSKLGRRPPTKPKRHGR